MTQSKPDQHGRRGRSPPRRSHYENLPCPARPYTACGEREDIHMIALRPPPLPEGYVLHLLRPPTGKVTAARDSALPLPRLPRTNGNLPPPFPEPVPRSRFDGSSPAFAGL